MRAYLLSCCLIALAAVASACGKTTSGPTDPVAVRSLVEQELLILQNGFQRGDVVMGSSIIDSRFTMDDNVSSRYRDKAWDGSGPQSFRSFLSDVFNLHANIAVNFYLSDVAIDGDLATATVFVDWHSQRTDTVP